MGTKVCYSLTIGRCSRVFARSHGLSEMCRWNISENRGCNRESRQNKSDCMIPLYNMSHRGQRIWKNWKNRSLWPCHSSSHCCRVYSNLYWFLEAWPVSWKRCQHRRKQRRNATKIPILGTRITKVALNSSSRRPGTVSTNSLSRKILVQESEFYFRPVNLSTCQPTWFSKFWINLSKCSLKFDKLTGWQVDRSAIWDSLMRGDQVCDAEWHLII